MNKAIFLDRDGTINVDFGYVHEAEKLIFIPGVIPALKRLEEAGYLLIVVTNQSGIGRGYFTKAQYDQFNEFFCRKLQEEGVHIAHVYMCPHISEDHCECRKPKTAMYEQAAKDYDIDWSASYAIGDKERDLSICKIKPVKGILLSSKSNENNWKDIADSIMKE